MTYDIKPKNPETAEDSKAHYWNKLDTQVEDKDTRVSIKKEWKNIGCNDIITSICGNVNEDTPQNYIEYCQNLESGLFDPPETNNTTTETTQSDSMETQSDTVETETTPKNSFQPSMLQCSLCCYSITLCFHAIIL